MKPRGRKRRPTLRTSHKVRIVNNDPDYERISALRDAKEKRFTAKLLVVPSLLLLVPTTPLLAQHHDLGALFAVGIMFALVSGGYWLSALATEARFH